MAWLMWVKDPVIREFAIQAGGGSFFARFTGNPAVQGNPFYNFGGFGQGHGQTGQYTGDYKKTVERRDISLPAMEMAG